MYTIAAIAHRLATQDNACTAHPIFVVQQRERIYGVDGGYTDDFVWRDEDWDEVDEAASAAAEAAYQTGEAPSGWHRDGYADRWVFVQPFFTRAAAEAYIEANRHRLTDPRVFVESAYRNKEWQAVVAFLPAASRCISAAHAVVEYLGQRVVGWDVREARWRLGELRTALAAAVKPEAPRGAQRDFDFAREAQAACEVAAVRAQGARALPGPVIEALELVAEAEQNLSGRSTT